jgi:hypothetical protein
MMGKHTADKATAKRAKEQAKAAKRDAKDKKWIEKIKPASD